MQAVRTATNAQSSGDCGRIMIVLLTDGRANVSLAKSNEEPDAIAEGAPKPTQELLKTEVLDMAKRCGSSGFNLLVIDTENKARPAVSVYAPWSQPALRANEQISLRDTQLAAMHDMGNVWSVGLCTDISLYLSQCRNAS